MEKPQYTRGDGFAQMGLSASITDIDRFVSSHSPLPSGVTLAETRFWAAAQTAFLREEILGDADWAEVVDRLYARLSV